MANAKTGAARAEAAGEEFQWRDVLAKTSEEVPELAQLLRPRPALVMTAYIALRLVYFAARV